MNTAVPGVTLPIATACNPPTVSVLAVTVVNAAVPGVTLPMATACRPPVDCVFVVNPLNVGLAVVCKSCGVAMLAYSVPTATVTPYVPARLNVDPFVTEVVPVVPFNVYVVLIAELVNATTRPYVSVVTTGTDVALPTVIAPGPTNANVI